MMTSLELLWLSLLLYLAGALLSLLLARRETLAIYASGLASLLGGVAGLFAAAPTLLGGGIITFVTAGPFPSRHSVCALTPWPPLCCWSFHCW